MPHVTAPGKGLVQAKEETQQEDRIRHIQDRSNDGGLIYAIQRPGEK
jgi:hypothetical protein